MSNALQTSSYEGSCKTMRDGRRASLIFKFYKPFHPAKHNSTYISLIENGAIAQYHFTMAFNCAGCNSCKPIRINTKQFSLSNEQKKILQKNRKGNFSLEKPFLESDAYLLYHKYMRARHPNSSMNNADIENFRRQVATCDKVGIIKNKNKIIAFSLLKINHNAIVCEYVVFDPDLEKQSLGNLMDLKLIEYAQKNGQHYLYIGEINLEAPKLKHKGNLSGSEVFSRAAGQWIPIERNPTSLDHIP